MSCTVQKVVCRARTTHTIQRMVFAHAALGWLLTRVQSKVSGEALPADAERTRLACGYGVLGLTSKDEPLAEAFAAASEFRLSADHARELSEWMKASSTKTVPSGVLLRFLRCPTCVGRIRKAPLCLATGGVISTVSGTDRALSRASTFGPG